MAKVPPAQSVPWHRPDTAWRIRGKHILERLDGQSRNVLQTAEPPA